MAINLVVGPLARGLPSSIEGLPKLMAKSMHNNAEKETQRATKNEIDDPS